MRLDKLLVSAAFIAGTAECFAPYPSSLRTFGRRISVQNRRAGEGALAQPAAAAAAQRKRSLKRPRCTKAGHDVSEGAAYSAAAKNGGLPAPAPLGLPPRLQAAVDMLGQDTDMKTKSKLLVELGDAFAKSDGAGLPPAAPPNATVHDMGTTTTPQASASALSDGWYSQKVPGCVSEVCVAVRVDSAPLPLPRGGAAAMDDSLSAGGGGGVVSIRGTADSRLSRGLLALLVLGLRGQSPRTVLSLRGKKLAAAVGMRAGLTDSRINGLGNILRVIQDLVRGHFRRASAAAAAAASPAGAAPTRVDLAGLQDAIPQSYRINNAKVSQVPARPSAQMATPGPATTPASQASSTTSTSTSNTSGLDPNRSWGDDASSWYPLPGSENEVAMLLSGGVDSSVAMRLLQDQGYKIRAFYLKIWLEDELAHLNECPWEEDLAYATAVCEQAGVPLEVVPLQKEYWDQVVSYTVKEAREGRTPNPDVMCNSRIKFGMFYDHVGKHFRYVATGHYARLERVDDGVAETARVPPVEINGSSGGVGGGGSPGRVRLLLSPDAVKDQTYFLCALTQDQLRKALFPLGAYTKEKIRELAKGYDLPTKDRKDSQGICFLGKLKFDEFLLHYLGTSPGTIVDQTGRPIGEHRGLWFHTIGQRKGVGPGLFPGVVNLGPWYVADKDMENNVLVVTNDREAIESPREVFRVEALQWISGYPPAELAREGSMRLLVKTRHGPQMRDCLLRLLLPQTSTVRDQNTQQIPTVGGGGASVTDYTRTLSAAVATQGYVNLDTKDSALAPGQFAAFYAGNECIGAGVMCGWSPAAAAAVGVAPDGTGTAEVGLEAGVEQAQGQQGEKQLGSFR